MKIHTLQIEEHSSGYAVTICADFKREEFAFLSVPDGTPLAGLLRLMQGANEEEDHAGQEEAPAPVRGRRRRAEGDAPRGRDGAPEQEPEPAPVSPPSGRAGRRPRPAGAAAEAPAREVGKKSRRPTKPQSPLPTPPSSAPTAEPRSRRGKKADTAQPAKSLSDEITDEDLVKAASLTAQKVSPPAVMAVLDEYAVAEVSKLPQEQRQEFLGRLKELRDG